MCVYVCLWERGGERELNAASANYGFLSSCFTCYCIVLHVICGWVHFISFKNWRPLVMNWTSTRTPLLKRVFALNDQKKHLEEFQAFSWQYLVGFTTKVLLCSSNLLLTPWQKVILNILWPLLSRNWLGARSCYCITSQGDSIQAKRNASQITTRCQFQIKQ